MKKKELLGEWINYALNSKNAHGIHSPFVFDFYNNCIKGNVSADSLKIFRQIRKELLTNNNKIHHLDLGAGSKVNSSPTPLVKQIAKASLKKEKEASLISKIVKYLKCKTVVELGTSFGTTTLLISLETPDAKIYTIEGSPEIAAVASNIFSRFPKNKIKLLTGSFDEQLPSLLADIQIADAFIFDGNHRKEATLRYFEQALIHSSSDTVFIFDDIRWSSGMLEAWNVIINHPKTSLSLDLFSMGIVFINSNFSKQNIKIK